MPASSPFHLPIGVSSTTGIPFNFRVMSGHEGLGRMFQYDLKLSSEVGHIPPPKVLGHSITVALPLDLMTTRYFNGVVVRFAETGRDGGLFEYHATICPQLWMLNRNRDCRVFQGATVPDVVKLILKNGNVKIANEPLLGSYRKWEYLTQYRESDFAFISRIMEHEGIYYYFTHADGAHTMVLADSSSAHKPRTGYAAIPVDNPDWPAGSGRADYLDSWSVAHKIQTNGIVLSDYDFRLNKGANLTVAKDETAPHLHGPFQRFDHPGGYLLEEDKVQADLEATQHAGDEYARIRLERERADLERIEASGNVRGLETGAIFGVRNVPLLAGTQFLVTSTHIFMSVPIGESGQDQGGDTFELSLTAINNERPYRPALVTPRPVVYGPQTARVVGDPGTGADEQIVTDEYGRIKVHFFWDRHAPDTPQPSAGGGAPSFVDRGNSCFIRVASSWAGSNWGSVHIPRIGQEVVVQFLDGDPDRPLVTGSVYNADNMPPYKLPEHGTQSGIKSRSTPRGTKNNFNEIRFEDKKGAEEIYVQAEKNQTIKVKDSRSLSVGGSESITISGARTRTVAKTDNTTVTELASQYFKNGHIQNVYGSDQEMFIEMGKTEYVTKLFSMESAEQISLKVGDSTITIAPDHIEIKAAKVVINGTDMVDVVGGVIKLNS